MSVTTTVVRGGTIVTMDPSARVFEGDVVSVNGRIVSMGPTYSPLPEDAVVIDARDCLVLPGFIQAHIHLGQTLFRGLAEGRELLAWLRQRIWPLEAAHDDESAYWSARLGAAECLRGGTTTVNDIGLALGMDGLMQGIADSGIKAIVGQCLMDVGDGVPAALRSPPEHALQRAQALHARWHGWNGRIASSICPRFVLSCSTSMWRDAVKVAEQLELPIHTHLLEHVDEEREVRALHGCGQIEFLDRVGALSRSVRAAHAVQFDADQAALLGERALALVHCPAANLKLGAGIADLAVWRRQPGVRMGLGCDGAACNNALDVLSEVRLAALLQQWRQGAGAFQAFDALALATCEGARALELAHEVGSLELGKRADVVVMTRNVACPPDDIYDEVVFSSGRERVRDVLVDGAPRVVAGQLVGVDAGELRSRAERERAKLLARVRWP